MNLDAKARASVEQHGADGAVPWALMASFLYYHRDATILSDEAYDWLTVVVREDFDFITHRHRDLLAPLRENSTSSLYQLRERDYPQVTRSAALGLYQQLQELLSGTQAAC